MECISCHSQMDRLTDKKVKLYGDDKNFYLCSNLECGHISVNITTEENIYFHQHDFRERFSYTEKDLSGDQITELFHEHMRPIVHKRIDFISPYLSLEKKILDIGAGSGTFALEVKDLVSRIDCLEVDQRLVNEISNMGFRVYNQPFENCKIKKTYFMITAWHVFEHITDGNAFLNKCHSILGKDGLVVLEVPYKRLLKRKYDGHAHHFSEKSLRNILNNNDFDVINYQLGLQDRSHVIIGQRRDK